MQPILRKPGSEVDTDLEGFPGVQVKYKVPDAQEGRQVQREINNFLKNDDRLIDCSKIVFGRLYISLDGIQDEDGGTHYEFERDKAGSLTEESAAFILPFLTPLWRLAAEIVGLRGDDEKN